MDILYLLIPLSLVLVFVIAGLFWWSLKSGQYEDLEGPGYRILMDDDKTAELPESGASVAAKSGPAGVKQEPDSTARGD
ncbi:MAG: cytochrome oxidase maturation protein, cbb3-type [Rhodocyclales bacterium RIFCSPLOWO2_02_FULL_63_24]|nr:MAG: cytochrome oxidase maturation protein, cbb3-type [Rhodocyclales bacterium GWA2_65_19]OHC69282.1 MAG: cytochrome oxidase maturation protein, cbb3-type [Rhodocyclales bacterium RIFCSPLOWO2_02_FULL_63_24]